MSHMPKLDLSRIPLEELYRLEQIEKRLGADAARFAAQRPHQGPPHGSEEAKALAARMWANLTATPDPAIAGVQVVRVRRPKVRLPERATS